MTVERDGRRFGAEEPTTQPTDTALGGATGLDNLLRLRELRDAEERLTRLEAVYGVQVAEEN